MSTILVTGMTAAFLSAAAAWARWRASQTAIRSLDIADDDPLMLDAMAEAQRTVDRLRDLAPRYPGTTHVKIRFASDSGTAEYLWAELREMREDDMEVFLVNLPVTHSEKVERLRTVPLDDLADWQVEMEDGRFEGGGTMRVLFLRAREQWGELPSDMSELERRY
ncbi:MAG TPA: hypothetical protein VH394_12695 [Thermoanaerobaculia bacterium]|jgi:uncharacterized protein YegJ (DUF2314 family)|nr:hypothetical protein [Thermoanaerobaculia bacterium]